MPADHDTFFYGHGELTEPVLIDIAHDLRLTYQYPLDALHRYCWPGFLRRQALVGLHTSLMCGLATVRLYGSPEGRP